MKRELGFSNVCMQLIGLISVLALVHSAVAQGQNETLTQPRQAATRLEQTLDQNGTLTQSRQAATRLEQILDQNGATGTARTDAKEIYRILTESKREAPGVLGNSQNIWEPTVFGKPCKEYICQSVSVGPPVPSNQSTSKSPVAPKSTPTPKSTPAPKRTSEPGNPCGIKDICPPGVGTGGGRGPRPLPPITPCGATSSCGPGVGRYGGTYDEKALQIMLHTSATQLTQTQPGK